MKLRTLISKQGTRCLAVSALTACTVVLAGCAIPRPLPEYQASLVNQQSLSRLPRGAHYRVEAVGEPSTIENSVRAYRITAPGRGSWGAYLHDGIRNELTTSGNYDANAASAIKVTLLAVQLHDGNAHLTARFVVEQGPQVRYDKTLHADGRWRTSMMGAIAVPAASQGAAAIFQNLLNQFFSDPDFVKSGA